MYPQILISFFLIVYNVFGQEINDTLHKGYLYPNAENRVYYGHFMNLKNEEIQNFKQKSKNRLCIMFMTKIEDSVTFTINDKKIYQGKMKDQLNFIVLKDKIDSFSVLSMYSHNNKSKSDVVLDLRMNSMQLYWKKYLNEPPKNYDFTQPLPYFWEISYNYRTCYNYGYEFVFPQPTNPLTPHPNNQQR